MGYAEKPRGLEEYGSEDLLTTADVLRIAKVSKHVIRTAVGNGDLPPVRLSERTVRFKVKDVRRWIDVRTYGRITPLRKRA